MNKKKIIFICLFLTSIVSVIIYYSIKSYLYQKEQETIQQQLMLNWFGYGSQEDNTDNTINPLYTDTIIRWEEEGLLIIMRETGVWTDATCKHVSDSFTNKDSLEYQILYGGISFDNIDYVDFTDAMLSIGWVVESGTYDPRDMHDYWEEAALKEATNDYE